jgi:TPR repeat protein
MTPKTTTWWRGRCLAVFVLAGWLTGDALHAADPVQDAKSLLASTKAEDHERGFRLLEAASQQGNVRATVELGRCYLDGKGVQKDHAKAFEHISEAAESGDGDALSMLGNLHFYGQGTRVSAYRAFECYQKATDAGSLNGQTNLARSYVEGKGVREDRDQGLALLRDAANKQHADAMVTLGSLLWSSTEETEQLEAVEWFRKAVKLNSSDGMVMLGLMLQHGIGCKADPGRAMQLYRSAVDLGNTEAHCALGESYLHGQGVPKDVSKGIRHYETANELGSALAPQKLSELYIAGQLVPKDLPKGIAYAEQAAERGNTESMNTLGLLHATGTGVPANDKKALEYFRQGADLGHGRAMLSVAQFHYLGRGGAKKNERAYAAWVRKAAEAGEPAGMYEYGLCLAYGVGVTRSETGSARWIEKAAEAGHADAQKDLPAAQNGDLVEARQAEAALEGFGRLMGVLNALDQISGSGSDGGGYPGYSQERTDAMREHLDQQREFRRSTGRLYPGE